MTLIEFYPVLKVGSNGWEPDVDIFETKDGFVISAELPGLKREDFDLTLDDHTLTLEAEKKREDKNDKQSLSERKFGKFYRSFVMPDLANLEKIRTSFKDGLLKVSIPKSEVAKREREIKVEFR